MAISLNKNLDERNDPPRPLLEHLYALRDMLIFAAVSWFICVVIAGCFANQISDWIKSPDVIQGRLLQIKSPADGVYLLIEIAFWAGTALSFPLLVYSVLRFIFPALTNREKYFILSVLCIGTLLFIGGVYLAYTQTVPSMLTLFDTVNNWLNIDSTQYFANEYVTLILKVLFAFGIVFQAPLIIFMLGWFGLVSSEALHEKRRIAIVLAFVLSMFLTPPDPLSQILMAVPLCLLYELASWAVWLKEKSSSRG
ncbi:MAG: twin-arginine translocase subunit TatC [Kiritimatiellae bacterium]|nr:twin-arginine translocase subunit TatC [Kiritimatiellia bacterium]